MKIIISHDVDHLYPSDHIFRDLVFSKLWTRSFMEMIRGKINFKTWIYRISSILDKRLNRIPEIIEFDKKHNIPSVFFFGMDNALGMSYKKIRAKPWVNFVLENGFDAGVHGVEIDDILKIQTEFNDFRAISGLNSFGIRTHYVRYNAQSFNKFERTGYLFDTSEFNKKTIELKPPFKIGKMWEIPLSLMENYVLKDDLENAIKNTKAAIEEAICMNLNFFTFLFHDYYFNPKTYPKQKTYYEWFVKYCIKNDLKFTSYRDAIAELERIAEPHYGQ